MRCNAVGLNECAFEQSCLSTSLLNNHLCIAVSLTRGRMHDIYLPGVWGHTSHILGKYLHICNSDLVSTQKPQIPAKPSTRFQNRTTHKGNRRPLFAKPDPLLLFLYFLKLFGSKTPHNLFSNVKILKRSLSGKLLLTAREPQYQLPRGNTMVGKSVEKKHKRRLPVFPTMGNSLMFVDLWLHTLRDQKGFYVVGRATIERKQSITV